MIVAGLIPFINWSYLLFFIDKSKFVTIIIVSRCKTQNTNTNRSAKIMLIMGLKDTIQLALERSLITPMLWFRS